MCRWVAYTGKPERLENVVTRPARSLVHQSLHAAQCKTATNGDGARAFSNGVGAGRPMSAGDPGVHEALGGSPLDARLTFDSFVVGRSNTLAQAAARQARYHHRHARSATAKRCRSRGDARIDELV